MKKTPSKKGVKIQFAQKCLELNYANYLIFFYDVRGRVSTKVNGQFTFVRHTFSDN